MDPPPAPTGVTATPVASDRIELEWRAPVAGNGEVTGYRVFRDGAPVASPSGTSHSDEGLTPFTTYQYRIASLRGDVEGERSDPVTARTLDGSPPSPPGNLTAEGVSATQVDLRWTAADDDETGIDRYRVFRDGEPLASPGGTSFSDTRLDAATTYRYEVLAVNGDGIEGDRAGPVEGRTRDPRDGSPPSVPGNLDATAVGATQVDLSWSPANDPQSGIAGYRVYRDGDQVGATGGTTFSDTGLEPSTRYAYAVSALNGEGIEGDESPAVSITTQRGRDDSPPSAPPGLSAVAISATQVNLTWDPASDPETGISTYRIYRNGNLGATVAATDDPSFSDTGLSAFTQYRYRVTAVNGDGVEGPESDEATVRTRDDSPPTTPSNFRTTAVTGTSVDLAWDAASDPQSGIENYRVYRNDALVGTPTATSFTAGELKAFTEYRFEVSAVNGDGDEGGRASLTVTTSDSPPTAPSNLTATAVSASQVNLSWDPASSASDIDHYRVYRNGSFFEATDGDETSFSVGELQPFTEYEFQVSAVNGADVEGPRSDAVAVRTRDDSPPSTPSNFRTTSVGATSVDLAWSAASDPESEIANYRVYRNDALVGTPAGTSFTADGLQSFTEYRFEVSAVNGDGDEGSRASLTVTTLDGTPPTAPTELTAMPLDRSVSLEWAAARDPETGVDAYRIYRNGTFVDETGSTSYVDSGLEAGTTYTYRVSAVNGQQMEGELSDPVTATTDPLP